MITKILTAQFLDMEKKEYPVTKKKAVATVACPEGKLHPERSVTKLSKGLGMLNELFITTKATTEAKREKM